MQRCHADRYLLIKAKHPRTSHVNITLYYNLQTTFDFRVAVDFPLLADADVPAFRALIDSKRRSGQCQRSWIMLQQLII